MNRRYRETFSQASKAEYESFMRITPCTTCHGQRLKQSSLAVTVGGLNIYEATNMSIVKFREFIDDLKLSEMQKMIGEQILKEIRARISFLIDVGLDYLSLSRATVPFPEARHSGSVWRPRSAPTCGVAISLMSRVSDCTREITISC